MVINQNKRPTTPPNGIAIHYDEITYKWSFTSCPGGLLTDENGKPITLDASVGRQSRYAYDELQKEGERIMRCMAICRQL